MKPFGLLLGCLLAVVLWPAPVKAQFFSPGDLAAVHDSLNGDDSCGECHTAGSRVSNDLCVDCHDDVGLTVKNRSGLHGLQFPDKSCGGCHVDHRGEKHDLIRWERDKFEHGDAGWDLNGAHAKTKCAECHDSRNRRGNPTFIGLETSCASCHEDTHKGRLGTQCQDCHDEEDWKNVDLDDFDHERAAFPLRGKHESVECAQCHGEPSRYQPIAFASCGDCHEDPHRGRFDASCSSCHTESNWKRIQMPRSKHPGLSLFGGHAKVKCKSCHDRGNSIAPTQGGECVSCHAPVHDAPFGNDCESCHKKVRWLGLPERVGRRAHAKTSYPLVGQHQKLDCAVCHDKRLPVATRYRGLDFDGCADCHEDVHKGQFETREEGECSQCHTEQGFAPTTFGVAEHASTGFSLTGGHDAAPCGSCHTGPPPRLDWQVEQASCASCHDNPHGQQFAAEMAQGGCASCHTSAAWDVPNIAHETWPLTGAHAAARCEQCHTQNYQDAPRECEGCHEDLHRGQFRFTEPVRGCEDCHTSQSFKVTDFNHESQASYALLGKHAEAECSKCHREQELSDGQLSPLWRLPYSECRDCHGDPHKEGE